MSEVACNGEGSASKGGTDAVCTDRPRRQPVAPRPAKLRDRDSRDLLVTLGGRQLTFTSCAVLRRATVSLTERPRFRQTVAPRADHRAMAPHDCALTGCSYRAAPRALSFLSEPSDDGGGKTLASTRRTHATLQQVIGPVAAKRRKFQCQRARSHSCAHADYVRQEGLICVTRAPC